MSVLLGVTMTGTGFAEPVITAPNAPAQRAQRPPGVQPSPAAEPAAWELSESTGFWLSLGGTAASWGLIVASTQLKGSGSGVTTLAALGTVGAPSLGHLYAESFGTRGFGIRLVGAGVASLGAFLRLDDSHRMRAATSALLYGGAALLVAGAIDDIVTVPAAVRRYNLRLHGLAIAPIVGSGRGGVALAARF